MYNQFSSHFLTKFSHKFYLSKYWGVVDDNWKAFDSWWIVAFDEENKLVGINTLLNAGEASGALNNKTYFKVIFQQK